ncbi:MAG: hypothetical protein ACPG56_04110 [Flavobacteriales bacterium]
MLLALGLSQCAGPGQPHLAPLRAAAAQVDEGMAQVGAWNVDTLAAIRTRVDERVRDLTWLMADSTLTFSVEDGQLIGDWARVKRHLKDAPQRIQALNEQGTLCNTQLANLIGAIRNGAEVDANGVAMDEVYFQRQAQNELNAVAKWLAFVEDTRRLIDAGMDLEAVTRAPMDSLLQAKRAEWAQQIAAE